MRTSSKTSSSRGGPVRNAAGGASAAAGKVAAAAGVAAAGGTSGLAGIQAGTAPQVLQSAVLGPALAAMAQMPEIDHAKVAELRDAIARGDLQFDAGKLAGLIQRFHGGRA
ncbi:flagellar biosynthesis anti-sigma factor FlgM [Aquincola tertiaricarbonis]|uniref:flagellar biosynthesis anti-sigma factor FlgM n=1 Tax=Aquincola tertiaricarbonis TaxID=391953 RepID=UPI0021756D46|nr:flagellar biosynthesis anti-sigma factor FlgM [Aquincola tertiaricarbonis]